MIYEHKKPTILVILLFICFSAGAQQWGKLFDDHWRFMLGDDGAAAGRGFDDRGWRSVELPHDWSIEGAPDRQNPSKGAGGYFPTGVGWYRKELKAPLSWKGREVSILFEGVYMNAEVFVNGKSLGIHPYGYSTFYYDISRYLDYGKRNVIALKVDNSQQVNCRWYSGSGIYRHVRLLVKDPLHIDPWGVAVTTPQVDSDKAAVNIAVVVKNDAGAPADADLSTVIVDSAGRVVARDSVRLRLPGGGEATIARKMVVVRPLLWSVESPRLYRVKMQLSMGGRRKDEYVSSFGIRTIDFSVAEGFRLNGRTMKLYGGCIHHDNGCLGAAAFDRAEERKVELLKAAGFNAVRTSHNPPSPALLDACDRLGMLVIDEAFDGWREAKNANDYTRFFDAWCRRDLESMVLRDRNHPSVVIWSVGNEILERKSPGAIKTARELVGAVHEHDMTRPVTSAMTTWDKEWEMYDPLFAVQDIGGYNYQLFRAASDHLRVSSRIIVQTESYARDAFVNWKIIRDNSYVIGDFVWTAMDYLGESGIGKNNYPGEPKGEFWQSEPYPWHGAYCGDLDITGWRKPVSHYRSILNNGIEKLYMAVREPGPDTGTIQETLWSVSPSWESWTWPGREGKDMQVEVYSRYPAVRLYLNGALVGEQKCTEAEEYKAIFTLPYAPGVLKAVGVGGGDTVVLRTAGAPGKIRLSPDRRQLAADGQGLSYVAVDIVDKDGVIDPNAGNRLMFHVEGPAVLAGVGNADMTDMDKYVGDTRRAWHGRALAVVRSTHQAGEIRLTVSSEGLEKGVIILNAGAEWRKSMEKGTVYPALKGAGQGVSGPGSNLPPEKMQWWEDQKFGMFIHWGLYAIPATGEWTMFNQKIPAEEYAKLADEFDPKHFSATEWARVAKEAGMKYMVMVSRHHDGFALWNSPSSYRHFNSWETAAHRDFVKEYTDACRKAGLYVGIYYSPLDWRFPGYFDPRGLSDNAALLKKQTYGQVEELMKNYGKIDILWYDGGWLAHKGTDADAAWFWEPLKLNAMVRSYNPDVVINPRSGMVGDFQTDEGGADVKGPIIPFPWEKCLNLNATSWGYNKAQHLMPLKQIIDMLVNTVDRGGNMLLNVGPDPDGVIPPAHVQRLKEVGKWLAKNGEGIYQTRPGPFQPVDDLYGAAYRDNKIYIHLLKMPVGPAVIKLPPTSQTITGCKVLHGEKVKFHQDMAGITLDLATVRPDSLVTTLVLKTKDN